MIQDRGNIKWTAMMLPEHAGLLRDWHDQNELADSPELDEFELTLLDEEIERTYKGKIITIDNNSKSIVLDDPFSTTRHQFGDIVAVSIIE